MSATDLANLAASVNHPIFWLGPKPGDTYELTQSSDGSIVVRYLPQGVAVGDKAAYTTVATYPFSDAYDALKVVAKQGGANRINLPDHGLAVVSAKTPSNVHAAYPGVDYQVEVFDPTPGAATAAVAGHHLAVFGSIVSALPARTTPAALKSLQTKLGHGVWWAGPKPGTTLELRQVANGSVYVRYLTKGKAIGAQGSFLTVATYPFPGAYAALQALVKQAGTTAVKLRGGIALVNSSDPNSIHLAYQGQDYQVEVYDPSAAEALKLVKSGKIVTVG